MSAKIKIPTKGDVVVVNHENSSETYYFDGENLVDSVGTMFTDKNIDWPEMWKTDKTWRFANEFEKNAYGEELWKNNLMVDCKTNKIVSTSKEDEVKEDKPSIAVRYCVPDGYPLKNEYTISTTIDVYKEEIVRLYDLLEDISTMAEIGLDMSKECNNTSTLLNQISIIADRRKRKVKTDGYNLFLNGEKLTDNDYDDGNEE